MKLELDIAAAGGATLTIDGKPTETLVDLRLRGRALSGSTVGVIDARDAERYGARQLSLELLPYSGSPAGAAPGCVEHGSRTI